MLKIFRKLSNSFVQDVDSESEGTYLYGLIKEIIDVKGFLVLFYVLLSFFQNCGTMLQVIPTTSNIRQSQSTKEETGRISLRSRRQLAALLNQWKSLGGIYLMMCSLYIVLNTAFGNFPFVFGFPTIL